MNLTRYDALYEESGSAAPPRVTVSFGESSLDIRDGDDLLVAQWSYPDLRPLGALRPGQAVVLTCTASPDAKLTLIDSDILPPLSDRAPQAVPARKKGDSLLGGCAIGGLAGCGAGCLALLALPFFLGGLAWLILGIPSWLASDPARALRLFDAWMTPTTEIALPPACEGDDGQEVLERMVRRLTPAGGLEDVPEIAVLKVDRPLALPFGDRLLLTDGLIARLDSGPQLAGVLAHTLGHLAQGDQLPLSSRHANDAWGLGVPACTGEADELEADAWALRALNRAGWRADGLQAHLDRLPRGMSGPWEPYLCHHPISSERLRAVRMGTPNGGETPMSDADFQAVKTICD